MTKAIYFDMDGTIANLYGVEGWLFMLETNNPAPYKIAKPLINMVVLSRYLRKLQIMGYTVGIISWLAKASTTDYDKQVEQAKRKWLKKHLQKIQFDEVHIVPYGTPKSTCAHYNQGILFDDEVNNREEWQGESFDEKEILKILKKLIEKS